MLKAIIIDDEKAAISQLKKTALSNDNVDIIAGFSDPLEGLETVKKLQPNIVFLDISMPEISGIYLAEQVLKSCSNTGIVFVTSLEEYAIKAFELNALDYLLKPVTIERFNQCIYKILNYGPKNLSLENFNGLGNLFKESSKKIFVDFQDETILIKPEDIYFFEVNDKTVLIKTASETYKSDNSLSFFEAKLQNSNFFRCHRSYLVNLDKISRIISYSKTHSDVGFKDIKETALVSKRNIQILKKLLEY